MTCEYFGKCGSCTLFEMDYESQLAYKVEKIKTLFEIEDLNILTSKPDHFRSRAEFRIYHDDDGMHYAMHKMDRKGILPIDSCTIVTDPIANIMNPLLEALFPNEMLRHKLYAVEFLASSTGNLLVTLIYHKKINQDWKKEAQNLATTLGLELIGRSRGVKIVVTKEYIDETLSICDKPYHYKLYDTGFTQPNSGVNEKMIGWVKEQIGESTKDLLELYCGHGNFTIPLSEHFDKVLATEISKRSIQTALENCTLNSVDNITFVRLSSEELTQALQKVRPFNRLKDIDLDSFHFDTVFVDPPRAGLDPDTTAFISDFKRIIYISCNPETLKRDLDVLKKKFAIERFAVFDQFGYTEHLECGVILHRF